MPAHRLSRRTRSRTRPDRGTSSTVVEMHPVHSEAIVAAGYDARSRVLAVRFESGGSYEYLDVEPELYDELLSAQPHPWSRIGERVKAHPFRRVG